MVRRAHPEPPRPRSSWLRQRLDDLVSALGWLSVRLFFRDIELLGAERIPHGGPLLLVANHNNSLMDPILLIGALHLRARILAKSTLWSHPVVAPLLVLAGALPVYRRIDPGARVARNFETFAACRNALAAGGVVALFPEGRSHNQPRPLPLKTGAARIALETEAAHGPLGLRIVPAGITYEAKDRFRSRVLIQVGEPLDPTPELTSYGGSPRRAAQSLTDRIARALEAEMVGHESWEESRLVGLAVALLLSRPEVPLSEQWALRRTVLEAYGALREHDLPRARELTAKFARYDRELARLRLTDAEVASTAPPRPRTHPALGAAALLGGALNYVSYFVPGWVARRLTRTPDEPATYKLITSLFAFPLSWAAEAAVAGALLGPAAALAMLLVAPLAGYACLAYHDRTGRFYPGQPQRGVRVLDPETMADLRQERAALADEARELLARYRPAAEVR